MTATNFTTGEGSAAETIPASDITYDPGTPFDPVGDATYTPGDPGSLDPATPLTAMSGSDEVGAGVSWDPTITVHLPPGSGRYLCRDHHPFIRLTRHDPGDTMTFRHLRAGIALILFALAAVVGAGTGPSRAATTARRQRDASASSCSRYPPARSATRGTRSTSSTIPPRARS